jgi:hypothetical protein
MGDTLAQGINVAVYTRLRGRLRLTGGSGGTGAPEVFFFREGGQQTFSHSVLPNIPINGEPGVARPCARPAAGSGV